MHIDITRLKSTCPLLTSIFQEVLGRRSMGISFRQVMEDTILEDRRLLKKDSMIQMPSRVMHTSSSLWGPDADEFHPKRFMRNDEQSRKDVKPSPAAAFRAFGGGSTLCPIRHFATNEVLAVVTMFPMRFDMIPATDRWTLLTVEKRNVASVMMEPDTDLDVSVFRRKGWEQHRCSLALDASNDVFAVVAEDRAI